MGFLQFCSRVSLKRIWGNSSIVVRNAWDLRTTIEEWPQIRFNETREQN